MRVLVAEDEERIASFLVKGLRAHGYVVEHVATARDATAYAGNFDLVILDLGLPDRDGIDVLKELRDGGATVPILVLTARASEEDVVEALDLGADDYLTKPFGFPELLARVRTRLRREQRKDGASLEAGGVALDLRTRKASYGSREVDLSAREFALLETLMRHRGQVLSREQLLSQVWGFDFDPGDRSNVVDVYVGYLRRKLGERCIETVRGAGYRLVTDD